MWDDIREYEASCEKDLSYLLSLADRRDPDNKALDFRIRETRRLWYTRYYFLTRDIPWQASSFNRTNRSFVWDIWEIAANIHIVGRLDGSPLFVYCKFGEDWDELKARCKLGCWIWFLDQGTSHLFPRDSVANSRAIYLSLLTGRVQEIGYIDFLAWQEEVRDRLAILRKSVSEPVATTR